MRNRLKNICDHLLHDLNIHPVLVDVGASGEPPKIWDPIATYSIYVGFDPDAREVPDLPQNKFYKSTVINRAVIENDLSKEANFYFTKFPYCSSTLKPNSQSLSHFLFSDLFIVEKETKVQSTSLNSVVNELSLPTIDWLKIDSQGIDLRIFAGLKDEMRSKILAIDIEPGLIDAYEGEDLFVDVHKRLTQEGFWLSTLNVGDAVRMRKSSLAYLSEVKNEIKINLAEQTLKKTPVWCEARYLRTVASLVQNNLSKNEFVLLWLFSTLDHQMGFALDLALEYKKLFGTDNIFESMFEETVKRIRLSQQRTFLGMIKSFLPVSFKDWLKSSSFKVNP